MTPIQEEEELPPTIDEMIDFLDREILPDLDNLLEMVREIKNEWGEKQPMWGHIHGNCIWARSDLKEAKERLEALKEKDNA